MFADIKDFNEKRYSTAESVNVNDIRIQKIAKLIGTGKSVLDLGCFKGDISLLIKQKGNEVYGVEMSKTCVDICVQKGLPVKVCDIEHEEIPFDQKFDCVLCGELIEHVIDTDGLLTKIYNALTDTGFLVVTTPNLASFGRRILLLAGLNPLTEVSYDEKAAGHLRYFVESSLKGLLEKNGFYVEEYTSDVINFDNAGRLSFTSLASLFPELGATIIMKCKKKPLQ